MHTHSHHIRFPFALHMYTQTHVHNTLSLALSTARIDLHTYIVKQSTQTLGSLPGSPRGQECTQGRSSPPGHCQSQRQYTCLRLLLQVKRGGEGGREGEGGGEVEEGGGGSDQAGNSHTVSSIYMHTPQWYILTRKPQIT